MPRYFFHANIGRRITDAEGSDLANVREARIEASALASILFDNWPEEFWHGDGWSIEVTDAQGAPVFAMCFKGEDRSPDAARDAIPGRTLPAATKVSTSAGPS